MITPPDFSKPFEYERSRPVEHSAKPLAFVAGVVKERIPRHPRRLALDAALKVARRALAGDHVTCPACGTSATRYIRGRCVGCSAAERQRLIALFVQRELAIGDAAPVRLLHFAPEPGLIRMFERIQNVRYVPADLNPDQGHEAVDATAIHVAPPFDGVITSHVLEHIPDDRAAIREMFRVLGPRGWALVVVPVFYEVAETYEDDSIRSPWARHLHYGQHDHVRLYGRDFPDRLRDAGFSVEERRYADELPEEEVKRYGLISEDVIHLCRKPDGRAGRFMRGGSSRALDDAVSRPGAGSAVSPAREDALRLPRR